MTTVAIIGRSSSHFTRVTRIFAHELGVPLDLVPIHDMTKVDAVSYGDNPARKMPTLRRETGALLFGTENICRALADLAGGTAHIVWPEQLRDDVACNAQELVWHGMDAQVQLVFGTVICKLPAENVYFAKGREGFEGALRWLDDNLASVLALLPSPRVVSLFEVTLYCLVDHVAWRKTLPLAPYPSLVRFAESFAARECAQRTAYHVDARPTAT